MVQPKNNNDNNSRGKSHSFIQQMAQRAGQTSAFCLMRKILRGVWKTDELYPAGHNNNDIDAADNYQLFYSASCTYI